MSSDHTVYTVHPPLRRQDYTVSLEEEAVIITSEKGKQKKILYSEILEINVSYVGEGMYRCLVKNKLDDRIIFPSHTSEDKDRKSQLDDFSAFVMELHSRTAQFNDRILYTQGLSFMFYLMIIITTISALIVISMFPLLILTGREMTAALNTSLLVTLSVVILVGFLVVLKVRPKTYNPAEGSFPYDIATIADLIKKTESVTGEGADSPSA